MNRHYLVVIGIALLVLFFCIWMIRRNARKEKEMVEQFKQDAAARQKARDDRAYRANRQYATQTPDDIARYNQMQTNALAKRNEAARNDLNRVYAGGQGSAAMETPWLNIDTSPVRNEGFSTSLAAPYQGSGGTFDGAGASSDWSSPPSDTSSSDSGSSSSDSSSSSSSD